jgi:hypothetical protein
MTENTTNTQIVETRTEAECTVTLEVNDANAVCAEVDEGQHQTFDDALHYIIERGVAEIRRQRNTAKVQKAQREDALKLKRLREILALSPAIAANPSQLAELLAKVGIVR